MAHLLIGLETIFWFNFGDLPKFRVKFNLVGNNDFICLQFYKERQEES